MPHLSKSRLHVLVALLRGLNSGIVAATEDSRALLLAGLHALKEAGMESAMLGVDAESLTSATRLYESVGFVERKRFILYRRPL